jgi:DNA-binding CsgD family transcriptional regulator
VPADNARADDSSPLLRLSLAKSLEVVKSLAKQVDAWADSPPARGAFMARIKWDLPRLVKWRREGRTLQEIADKLKCNPSTVAGRLRQRDAQALMRKLSAQAAGLRPQTRAGIARDYRAGGQLRELARKYRTSPRIVREVLLASGAYNARGAREKYDWDKMEKDYRDGLSVLDVAEKQGCTWQTVVHALKRRGVALRGRQPELDYDRMLALHRKGYSCAQIAEELGCSAWTVTVVLRRKNRLKGGRRGRPSMLNYARVREMYRKGHSGREIAEHLDISKSHVYRILGGDVADRKSVMGRNSGKAKRRKAS